MLEQVLKIVSALVAEAPQTGARTARRASEFGREAGRRTAQFRKEASHRASDFREEATRKASDLRDEVADRVHRFEKRVSSAVSRDEGDTLENVALFVTGLGVGVGLALLFTPSSGSDLRASIRNRASEVVDSFRNSYREAVEYPEDDYIGV